MHRGQAATSCALVFANVRKRLIRKNSPVALKAGGIKSFLGLLKSLALPGTLTPGFAVRGRDLRASTMHQVCPRHHLYPTAQQVSRAYTGSIVDAVGKRGIPEAPALGSRYAGGLFAVELLDRIHPLASGRRAAHLEVDGRSLGSRHDRQMNDRHSGAVEHQPLGSLGAGRTSEGMALNSAYRRCVGLDIHQAHLCATRQTLHCCPPAPYC